MDAYCPGIQYYTDVDYTKEVLIVESNMGAKSVYNPSRDITSVSVDGNKVVIQSEINPTNPIYALNKENSNHFFLNIIKVDKSVVPTSAESTYKNNTLQANNTIISEDEAKAIVKEVVPKAAIIYGSVFNGSGYFKIDTSVTIPNENNYALIVDEKIKTMNNLKSFVEETFTKETAETAFYNVYLKDIDLPLSSFNPNEYTPLYYEYKGQLYVNTANGGKGFTFDWLYDTTKLVSNENNAFTATIDRTLFKEFDETNTINFIKTNNNWLVANDFINN